VTYGGGGNVSKMSRPGHVKHTFSAFSNEQKIGLTDCLRTGSTSVMRSGKLLSS